MTYSARGRPVGRDQLFVEGDALVAAEKRRAEADLAIPAPQLGGNVRDLEAPWLALADRPAEQGEGFEEEGANEVRLELAGFGSLHLVADPFDVGDGHDVVDQRSLVDDISERFPDGGVHDLVETGLGVRLLAVADRFDE